MIKNISIIGGGNLGTAITEGLIKSKYCKPAQLTLTRRNTSLLKSLAKKGVNITADNSAAVSSADLIIFAVKPFQIAQIIEDCKHAIKPEQVIVSVITGVSVNDLRNMLGMSNPIFRAMPNTAIAIRESMTCIYADAVHEENTEEVKTIFSQLGKVAMINENLMDAATVLGACGTAYAMRFIRANIQGGIEIGFDSTTASLIAAQTVKGAAELLLQNGTHPEQEIDKVTTPKGCTIAGLNEMEHQGFSSSLIKGIATSYNKIVKG